jgi:hypothetical protein
MNGTYDLEPTLDRWFAAGSTLAPDGSIERAVAAAVLLPQARRPLLRQRRSVVNSPTRALMAAGAVVAIVASLALGPWAARPTIAPPAATRMPGDTPAPSEQPTASPDVRPSTSPAAEPIDSRTMSVEFTSDQHRYSIRYPEDWRPVAALDADEPDRIHAPAPSATVLSIQRFPMPEGVGLRAFADEHLRHRAQPEGCRWSSGIIFIAGEWDTLHEITVDARPGAYRSECGYVDAVVQDGGEFLGITLKSGQRKATGDVWWFERFVESLTFADDVKPLETPAGTTLFISVMHDYTIRYPSDWRVSHATREGDSDMLYDAPLASPESEFKSTFVIRRRDLPAGNAIADVAEAWLPVAPVKRGECGNRQPFYGTMPHTATFQEGTIAGRPALVRSECSVVDAIVDLDGEALLLTLRSRRSMDTGDDRLFNELIRGLAID